METLTLTDFLLARIAEDEEAARTGMGQQKSYAFPNISGGTSTLTLHHEGPFAPTRVLAECEAKRRIIEIVPTLGGILRALAAVYSDHPDYRHEWKP